MKERPILFNAPMVRALLDGIKTQTRRVVKVRGLDFVGGGPKDGPDWNDPSCWGYEDLNTAQHWALAKGVMVDHVFPCPYGQTGDRLWVREAWGIAGEMPHDPGYVEYRADCQGNFNDVGDLIPRWRPSIHMPRSASRILLEIIGVRVERLNACSDADALAEGVDRTNSSIAGYAKERYRRLWEFINGAGSWDANPWVWVVEFRTVTT